jgi:electron-transferring-flavoprotein dehydrogenase
MKHHPFFAKFLEGGECLAYGARALNEGGLQSIPKLHFPGGALLGCSAGFLNVPKVRFSYRVRQHQLTLQIKGTHNAMKSGMLAAETAYAALHPHLASSSSAMESASAEQSESEAEVPEALDMSAYEQAVKDSYIWKELNEVRNLRPSFHNPLGMYGGIAYSGVDSLILKGRTPWTLRNKREDYQATKKAR